MLHSCPHARGGEPSGQVAEEAHYKVVPTHVGVNRSDTTPRRPRVSIVPTHVGVNRPIRTIKVTDWQVVPTHVGVNRTLAC